MLGRRSLKASLAAARRVTMLLLAAILKNPRRDSDR